MLFSKLDILKKNRSKYRPKDFIIKKRKKNRFSFCLSFILCFVVFLSINSIENKLKNQNLVLSKTNGDSLILNNEFLMKEKNNFFDIYNKRDKNERK